MKILKSLLYALSLFILVLLQTGCDTKFDQYENEPVWLGSNIYDYLNSEKTFTNYVKLIDDCGYKETMQRTGSVTLFVADDDAFDRFFANNPYGIKSYTDLTKPYKYMILRSGLLENPYLIERLGTTDQGAKGQVLRRTTALKVLDFVPLVSGDTMPSTAYWNRFKNRKFMLLQDGSQWTMVHFIERVMASKGISNEDFEFITGKIRQANDAYVFDNKVVKGDLTCKNGYVHKMENVLIPPSNMAAYIRSNKSVSQYNSLMNRFCAPYFYGLVEDSITHVPDSVFQFRYFNSGTGVNELTKAPDSKGAASGGVVDATLMFDPGWNLLQTSSGSGVYASDMPAMFVPTNDAMAEYFSPTGIGNDLYDQFKTWDNVPNSIAADFVSNHMKKSFLASLPSQFPVMKDEAGYAMDITKSNIVSSYLSRNGLVYTVNKVLPPLDYRTVIGPVKVNSVVSMFQKGQSDSYVKFIYYFRSMLNKYSYFATLDANMNNYRDPVAQGYSTANKQTWKFKVVTNGTIQAVAKSPSKDSIAITDSRITNRLQDIFDLQTIVGNITPGQEYYITKGYGAVRVHGNVEPTANGQNMFSVGTTLEGGGNIERGTLATVQKNYSKENGCTYFIDGILENPVTSVFGCLQNNPQFSEFFNMLNQADVFQSMPSSGTKALNFKVDFFNQYHYTVYVPTNDAIKDAINRGIVPSQADIDNAATTNLKNALILKRLRFLRYHFQDNSVFIGGEIVSGKNYLSGTISLETDPACNRTTDSFSVGKFYPLTVTNTNGQLQVKAFNGETANVLKTNGCYNVMTRDVVVNNPNLDNATTIVTSSFAVVHLIDKVLQYE